jgi:hypothetical protein
VQGRIGLKRVGTHQVLHHLIYLLMGGQNVEVQHVPAVPEDVARSHVMISYSTVRFSPLLCFHMGVEGSREADHRFVSCVRCRRLARR